MPVSIRIDAPDFGDWVRGTRAEMAKAVTAAVRIAADGLKSELREQVTAAGLGRRLPNAIGVTVYPRGDSLGAAAVVAPKGRRARMLLELFTAGAEITPRNAKYLLVPTEAGRKSGLLTTMRLENIGGGGTSIVRRRASDLGFARASLGLGDRQVITVVPPGKMHKSIGFVIARGVVAARGGRGFRAATRARLAQGRGVRDVVLFLLIPKVTIKARLHPERLAEKWAGLIPGLIDRALPGASTAATTTPTRR